MNNCLISCTLSEQTALMIWLKEMCASVCTVSWLELRPVMWSGGVLEKKRGGEKTCEMKREREGNESRMEWNKEGGDVRNLRNEKAASGGKKRGTSEIKEVDGNEKKRVRKREMERECEKAGKLSTGDGDAATGGGISGSRTHSATHVWTGSIKRSCVL